MSNQIGGGFWIFYGVLVKVSVYVFSLAICFINRSFRDRTGFSFKYFLARILYAFSQFFQAFLMFVAVFPVLRVFNCGDYDEDVTYSTS